MFVAIVFPLERDLSALQGNKPFLGDGDAVGIAAEIGESLLRAAEGWFCINNPFPFFVRRHTGVESKGIPEWFDRAEEVQKPLIKSVFQEFEKDPTEQVGEYLDVEEESGLTVGPAFVVSGETAAWHNEMHVGVMQQVLPP